MSSAFSPQQLHRARALYRSLLRAERTTFAHDDAIIVAARAETRKQFQAARTLTADEDIEKSLNMGQEVVKVLRSNVVQGKWDESKGTFKLQMSPETELGSNETIRQGRQAQMDALRASKGKLSCGESVRSSLATSGSARAFSTLSISRAEQPSTSASASNAAASGSSIAASASASSSASSQSSRSSTFVWPTAPASSQSESQALPRPVPLFPTLTLLADGSSIELQTTSPRASSRLARDPTNHPLWNPRIERRSGGGEDESGRLGRFKRRFGAADDAAATTKALRDAASGGKAPAASKEDRGDVYFGEDDLDWMSVGGREAKAGTPLPVKGGGGKKGKK